MLREHMMMPGTKNDLLVSDINALQAQVSD